VHVHTDGTRQRAGPGAPHSWVRAAHGWRRQLSKHVLLEGRRFDNDIRNFRWNTLPRPVWNHMYSYERIVLIIRNTKLRSASRVWVGSGPISRPRSYTIVTTRPDERRPGRRGARPTSTLLPAATANTRTIPFHVKRLPPVPMSVPPRHTSARPVVRTSGGKSRGGSCCRVHRR
jgi:hypothetical protein